LDWRTRGELVPLLSEVKKERAVLVVSHDLQELAPLVDFAWRMMPGGNLEPFPVEQLSKSIL
jgi:energy-coupling factor transporter ATP-binding protein EcfA2